MPLAVVAGSLAVGCSFTDSERSSDDVETAALSVSNDDGEWAIYAISAQSAARTRLAPLVGRPAEFYQVQVALEGLAWSPLGTHAAIPLDTRLEILDLRSGHRTVIEHPDGGLGHAAWSADGRRVAYTTDESLLIVDQRGKAVGGLHVLGEFLSLPSRPAWSPDGERVAYEVPGRGIEFRPVSGGPADLVVGFSDAAEPVWSADGSRFAYIVRGIVKVRGTGERTGRRVGEAAAAIDDERQLAWSPDGASLAFSCATGMCVADAEKNRARTVVRKLEDDERLTFPAWSPDGRRLLYLRSGGAEGGADVNGQDLWIVDLETGKQRALTQSFRVGASTGAPGWTTIPLRSPKALPVVTGPPPAPAKTFRVDGRIDAVEAEGSRAAVVVDGCALHVVRSNAMSIGASLLPKAFCAGYRQYGIGEPALDGASVHVTHFRLGDRIADEWSVKSFRPGTSPTVEALPDEYDPVARIESTTVGLVAFLPGTCIDSSCLRRGGYKLLRLVEGGWHLYLQRTDSVVDVAVGRNAAAAVLSRAIHVHVFGQTLPIDIPTRARAVVLDAASLVALGSDGRLTRWGLDGRKLPAAPVMRLGPHDVLQATRDGFVAYSVGSAIHVVDIADGRQVTYQAPTAAPLVHAQLTDAGLFYSWTSVRTPRPRGRLTFVPRSVLERGLR